MKFCFNSNKKGIVIQLNYIIDVLDFLKVNVEESEEITKGYFIYDVYEHSLSLSPRPCGKEFEKIHDFINKIYLFSKEKNINYDKKIVEKYLRKIELLDYKQFSFLIPEYSDEANANILGAIKIFQDLNVYDEELTKEKVNNFITGRYLIYDLNNNKLTIEDEHKGSITNFRSREKTVETLAVLAHLILAKYS